MLDTGIPLDTNIQRPDIQQNHYPVTIVANPYYFDTDPDPDPGCEKNVRIRIQDKFFYGSGSRQKLCGSGSRKERNKYQEILEI